MRSVLVCADSPSEAAGGKKVGAFEIPAGMPDVVLPPHGSRLFHE